MCVLGGRHPVGHLWSRRQQPRLTHSPQAAGGGGWYGPKGLAFPDSDGGFTLPFVTDPHDVVCPKVAVLVVPADYAVPLVLGVALPQELVDATVASVIVDRA